jgi:hypothetical protein
MMNITYADSVPFSSTRSLDPHSRIVATATEPRAKDPGALDQFIEFWQFPLSSQPQLIFKLD